MYPTSSDASVPSVPRVCEGFRETGAGEKKGLSPRALGRVLRFIGEHYCEGISLQDLAESACVSRFHFSRQFRASTGSSPMEFVRKIRIEAARTMLSTGHQKIATVAACLGFFDQSHFTRTFRRVTGVPPRVFARQQDPSHYPFASRRLAAGTGRPASTLSPGIRWPTPLVGLPSRATKAAGLRPNHQR